MPGGWWATDWITSPLWRHVMATVINSGVGRGAPCFADVTPPGPPCDNAYSCSSVDHWLAKPWIYIYNTDAFQNKVRSASVTPFLHSHVKHKTTPTKVLHMYKNKNIPNLSISPSPKVRVLASCSPLRVNPIHSVGVNSFHQVPTQACFIPRTTHHPCLFPHVIHASTSRHQTARSTMTSRLPTATIVVPVIFPATAAMRLRS